MSGASQAFIVVALLFFAVFAFRKSRRELAQGAVLDDEITVPVIDQAGVWAELVLPINAARSLGR